jgi:hypothetical protein
MTEKMCLLRADECERRAGAASDRQLKAEWSQLSIEWHYLATCMGRERREEQDEIVVAERRAQPAQV